MIMFFRRRATLALALAIGVAAILVSRITKGQSPLPLQQLKLPAGFTINVYVDDIENARSMTLSPSGTLYVGSQNAGKVYAIPDRNKDNKPDEVITLARNLNTPNGVAFKDGSLYVAEINRILRFDNIESKLKSPGNPTVIYDRLPTERHHGWKFIRFGPDELLYVPVGAPCNICEPDPGKYAAIFRMKSDGTGFERFAQGVRNTVGFDWHPRTRELWFTDNGRDLLGDEVPSDELNHAPSPGLDFGYPYCHQGNIADPEFGATRKCAEFVPPAQNLGPHVAALGMRFYTGPMFPAAYRNQIFIAQHGSWNRSPKAGPIGYRVMVARLDEKGQRVVSYEKFAEGWLQGSQAWGRPVDVEVLSDGSLLVSDDTANVIYRITYGRAASP